MMPGSAEEAVSPEDDAREDEEDPCWARSLASVKNQDRKDI